ncbi:MAG: hypothetical protein H7Z75_00670 [Ferruginibacter sp.]|nr:hypothetical protein [Cytophagales bacterium]
MKRFSFSLLLSALFLGPALTSARAQGTDSTQAMAKEPRSAEARAQALTDRMAKKLALSGDQTNKVQAINLEQAQKLAALQGKYAGNRRQGVQEMKAVNQAWDRELQAVLTPEQFTNYQNLREEKKEARREKSPQRRKSER